MNPDNKLESILKLYREKLCQGVTVRLEELCAGDTDLLDQAKKVLQGNPTLTLELDTQFQPLPLGDIPKNLESPAPGVLHFPGYEIKGEIGRGGMGVVYRAVQPSLGREVAIKTLFQGGHLSADLKSRLKMEAAALGMMQHANIVQIFDVNEVGEMPFLVMELVDGVGLEVVLANRLFSPKAAATLLVSLAEGIQTAHLRGVIHRDLKPGNILLAGGKKVAKATQELELEDLQGITGKISDFGLAKKMDSQQRLTHTRAIVGTPCYMATEQANPQFGAIGPATDIYSLGAILYEMLVGKPPFLGGTIMETLRQVVYDDPISPSTFRPGIPRNLETICLKCLEKNPKKRYADAAALASDLRAFISGDHIQARAPTTWERLSRWTFRHPWRASALLGAALVLISLFFFQHYRERKNLKQIVQLQINQGISMMEQGDFSQAALWLASALEKEAELGASKERLEELRYRLGAVLDQIPFYLYLGVHDGPVVKGKFLPDGTGFLTAGSEGGVQFVRDGVKTDFFRHKAIPGDPIPILDIALVDNDRFLASYEDAAVLLWSIKENKPLGQLLFHGTDRGPDAFFMALAPDGKSLVTSANDGIIVVWDLSRGVIEQKVQVAKGVNFLACHPDSRRFAACVGRSAYLFSLNSPEKTLFTHDDQLTGAIFSPSGKWMATTSKNGTAKLWEVESGQLKAVLSHKAAVQGARFSPGEKSLVTFSKDCQAILWEIPSGKFVFSVSHESYIESADISHDGEILATGSDDNTVRLWDMATGSPLGSTLMQSGCINDLKFHPQKSNLLSCSDDHMVAYWKVEKPAGVLAMKAGDGREPLEFLHFSQAGNWLAAVSRKGELYFWENGFANPMEALKIPPRVFSLPEKATSRPTAFAASSKGGWLAFGNEAGQVLAWQLGAPALSLLVPGPGMKTEVTSLAFHPAETGLIAGFTDGSVRHWVLAHPDQTLDFPRKTRYQAMVSFHPQGKFLALFGGEKKCSLFAYSEFGQPTDLQHPQDLPLDGVINGFYFHPSKPWGLSTTHNTRVWNLENGKDMFQAWEEEIKHATNISAALFSPRESVLATGGEDNVAILWNFQNGARLFPPFKHKGTVLSLQFNRQGNWLLTSATDGMNRLWNCDSGEPVVIPRKLPGALAGPGLLHPTLPVLLRSSNTVFLNAWQLNKKEEFEIQDIQEYAKMQSSMQLTEDGANTVNLTPKAAQAIWTRLREKYPDIFNKD
ncbi:MAG: hypothetical protein EXR99_08460 [Gemmataceae bacterium]|nr:hypothetical protein [Gemmataceae bacterium]